MMHLEKQKEDLGPIRVPKGIRTVLVRPWTVALVHVETSVTLIYIWGICEATDSWVLYPTGTSIAWCPKSLWKCADGTSCWPGHPELRWRLRFGKLCWPLGPMLYRGHPGWGMGSSNLPPRHRSCLDCFSPLPTWSIFLVSKINT